MAVDPQLLADVLERLRDKDIAGAKPEELVEWTLETLIPDEQWRTLHVGDDSGPYEDDESKVFSTVDELLSAFGPRATNGNRVLEHRFVMQTDWQQVEAQLDWRPV